MKTRTYSVDEADTQPTGDPRDQRHIRTLAASLQSSPDKGEDAPDDDSLFPAISVSESPADETSDHGTEIVDGDDTALFRRIGDRTVRTDVDRLDVVGYAIDEAHHSLIVAYP